ncbi:MAG TPA: DUF4190 domain-containing protein [Acidimicrobiales bacterium]|jgi:hypothetical protein|nr:DUF4190 domain-containing protein [Acidimicrobiales bacterium]
MSDTAQGSGWWQASDGRWYPPDARPGVPPPPEAASAGWSSPPGGSSPGWETPQAPGSYNPGAWAQQSGATPYRAATNGLAIAALVLGIIGIPGVFALFNVFAILALIFGLVSRSQIQRSGGTQGGAGMAMAGIVLGTIGIALDVIWIIVAVTSSVYSS